MASRIKATKRIADAIQACPPDQRYGQVTQPWPRPRPPSHSTPVLATSSTTQCTGARYVIHQALTPRTLS